MLRGVKSFEASENNCQRLGAGVTETSGVVTRAVQRNKCSALQVVVVLT